MDNKRRVWPRIKLRGNDLLNRSGVIYTQILGDLLMKVDDGSGDYPKGFLHTSTTTMTVPNYHHQMWSRDVGRGIMELIRTGFLDEANQVVDFIFKNGMTYGNHYGRTIETGLGAHEIDGNVSVLLACHMLWRYEGKKKERAQQMLNQLMPVFEWFKELLDESPYTGLLKSQSELSGNPETDYFVYAVFATYGAATTCNAYLEMAEVAEDNIKRDTIQELHETLQKGLQDYLISRGPEGSQETKTPEGVWINGIDERTGLAAEEGDFGPKFDMHRWTRQLPFIQDYDVHQVIYDGCENTFDKTNQASYQFIKDGMNEGYYFRRYGFVSNTCWAGMGDRHDDTMAGYGQNYFTQAALLNDDVNVYTKCLEGISRLAYDGNVTVPLTIDLNPWVMHECFYYPNYEKGYDHTFGANGNDERKILHNPGDEGNLVQSAETLKTFSMVAGLTAEGKKLSIKPRLPWECTEVIVKDYPVPTENGIRRISYQFILDREENSYEMKVQGVSDFDEVEVRIGPLPNVLFAEKELEKTWTLSRKHEATFATKVVKVESDTLEIVLVNED